MERRALGDAGIDDQHLDRTVRRAGFVERAVQLFPVGDVGLDRGPADDLADEVERLRAAAEHRHLRAAGIEVVAAEAPMPVPPPVISAWRPCEPVAAWPKHWPKPPKVARRGA